jgi:hypothetical protein
MMNKSKLSQDEIGTLILIVAILFGAWFRIMPAWLAGFPVNDGGMFYTMILDLHANDYIAPLFTTYNQASIPFAYPPLGFYIGAGLSDLFGISPIEILRWLPGIFNALCVPAFYLLAKEVLKDKFQSAIATLVFAMTPHLTSWLSMGGGLTRSLGMFFMLLALTYIHRVFASGNRQSIWGAIIFSGLTALSHTEAPIYLAAIAIYIWLMKSRSWIGLRDGALIALGVLTLSAPWYGLVILRHGVNPFLSIAQTGAHSFAGLLKILNIALLTEEPYLGILGALGILGIAALIARKDYFIPLMLPVIFLAQPRSGHVMGNIPLAMAAGFFITEIVLPGLEKVTGGKRSAAFFAVLAIYLLSNSMFYGLTLSARHLTQQERDAMQWVKENASKESKFLVISGEQTAFCDLTNEWFPTLTERQSLTTIQGSEWLLGDDFAINTGQIQALQGCIDEGLECFENTSTQLAYDYVYISIASPTKNCEASDSFSRTTRGLVIALENAEEYSIVYRSEKVVLFEKK